MTTVAPPVSDRSQKRRFSGRLGESSNRFSFPSRGPDASTFYKTTYCTQFSSYDMCSSISSLKGLRILCEAQYKQRTQRSDDASSGRLQQVENHGKLSNRHHNKQGFNQMVLTGKLLVFWKDQHSLTSAERAFLPL